MHVKKFSKVETNENDKVYNQHVEFLLLYISKIIESNREGRQKRHVSAVETPRLAGGRCYLLFSL